MQLNLTGRHVEITDSLRDYVNTKFAKLEGILTILIMFMSF